MKTDEADVSASETAPSEARRRLAEGDAALAARVAERMAALDRRLPDADGPTDLAKYLRGIAESAVASPGVVHRMQLWFAMANNCVVPATTASFAGGAVNELVMNSIQHAHPSGIAGQVFIACDRQEATIIIDVVDDGVGLPEGFDPMTDGEWGLQLARSIAVQLNARLEFTDTGTGLHVRLSIPA